MRIRILRRGFSLILLASLCMWGGACAAEKKTATTADQAKKEATAETVAADTAKKAETQAVPAAVEEKVPAAVAAPAIKTAGPTDTLKNNIEELKSTLGKHKKTAGDKGRIARNEEVRKKVRLLLDYNHLGRLALGQHWKKTSQKNKSEFLKLFRSLIEKSYLSKLDSLVADYEMKWLGEAIKGNDATVNSSVIRETADVEIEYKMARSKAKWIVYNIIFDDLNLANNYFSQFNKIITEKGIGELLTKMRKKLKSNDTV